MFEAPSVSHAEEFKQRFFNSGLNEQAFEDIYAIAESYDKLRQLCRLASNQDNSKEREMAEYFEQVLIRAVKNQEVKQE